MDAHTTIYSVRCFLVLYSTMLDVDLSLSQAYRRKTIFSTSCHLVSYSWALSDTRYSTIHWCFRLVVMEGLRFACKVVTFPKSVHMHFHGSSVHVHVPCCKTSPTTTATTTMFNEHTIKPHSSYHIPYPCFARDAHTRRGCTIPYL